MIVDALSNSKLYRGLSAGIDRAFDWLHKTDLAALAVGDYEIDGQKVVARVRDYDSRPREKGMWEAHRRFIDLQYVAAGEELIGYAALDRLTAGDYDPAKDFMPLTGAGDMLTVKAGSFALLWPTDAHMPAVAVNAPAPVHKVVIKIAVD